MSVSIAPFAMEGPASLFKERKRTSRDAPAHDEVVARGESLFQDSRGYRDDDLKMQDRWESDREWYLSTGRSWSTGAPSTTYVNLIASNADGLTAALTDPKPQFRFRAPDVESVGLAEYLNASVPPAWLDQKGPKKHRGAVQGMVIFGTWFKKVTHEPSYGGVDLPNG